MKKLLITSMLALLVASGSILKAQDRQDDYLGLPGDNLNLYAVMDLFQNSITLEEFERKLNDENSRINNLDLNGDNMVDYISVADHVQRGVHNIVLSIALNSFEKQDVAVFIVERFRNGAVEIQLIGDEALYGRNYIIEPIYADNGGGTSNPGYYGATGYDNNNVITTTYVEVAAWPLISYIYSPDYVVWNSSWYWDYYPTYWHPWNPFSYHYYYGYYSNWYPDYYRHYRHWDRPRYAHYNDYYYRGIRSHSMMVADRIREGHYRNTYSHPEQRRDGEALYNRMHSDRNSTYSGNYTNRERGTRFSSGTNTDRSSGNRTYNNTRRSNNSYTGSNVTNSSRRSNNSYTGSNVTNSSRRSNNSYTGSNVTNSSRRSNNSYAGSPITNSSRRSNNSYTGSPVTNSSRSQNMRQSNRSTATVSDRSISNRNRDQNTGVSRRSAVTTPDRNVSNRSFSQNARTNNRSIAPASDRNVSRREIRSETASSARRSDVNVSSQNRRVDREVRSGGSVRSNDRNKGSDNSNSSRRR